jgi:hypothetical protein
VQTAKTTTPAAARRALALAVKRSELNLKKLSRRQVEGDEEEEDDDDEEEYRVPLGRARSSRPRSVT